MKKESIKKESIAKFLEDNSFRQHVANSLLCRIGYFNRTVSQTEAKRRLLREGVVDNLIDGQAVLDYLSEISGLDYQQNRKNYHLEVDKCNHFGKDVYFFRQETSS